MRTEDVHARKSIVGHFLSNTHIQLSMISEHFHAALFIRALFHPYFHTVHGTVRKTWALPSPFTLFPAHSCTAFAYCCQRNIAFVSRCSFLAFISISWRWRFLMFPAYFYGPNSLVGFSLSFLRLLHRHCHVRQH